MLVGRDDQIESLQEWEKEAQSTGTKVELLDSSQAQRICPALRSSHLAGAVWEPTAADMDVAAIHQAFVRGARGQGAQVRVGTPVTALEQTPTGWKVTTGEESEQFQVVINAAGAWGDDLARLAGVRPVGVTPMRRTVFMAPGAHEYEGWPLVANVEMEWYFKPDGVQLLCSLSEEKPSPPCDPRPEPLDIALAIERINQATTLGIRSVRSSWTGLRTFASDREMVIGFDPRAEGFFWLVGQGGTGIQTSPGAGELTASLVLDSGVSSRLLDHGLDTAVLSPARFS